MVGWAFDKNGNHKLKLVTFFRFPVFSYAKSYFPCCRNTDSILGQIKMTLHYFCKVDEHLLYIISLFTNFKFGGTLFLYFMPNFCMPHGQFTIPWSKFILLIMSSYYLETLSPSVMETGDGYLTLLQCSYIWAWLHIVGVCQVICHLS